MNAAQIIEALGDTAKVAAELGVTAQAVSNWKSRGLSRRHALKLHQMAQRLDRNDITLEMVLCARPGAAA